MLNEISFSIFLCPCLLKRSKKSKNDLRIQQINTITHLQTRVVAHETTTVQVTVILQLNQGERKKSAVYLFFLDFFVTFCVKTKSKRKKIGYLNYT